jgi:hypothetical protein
MKTFPSAILAIATSLLCCASGFTQQTSVSVLENGGVLQPHATMGEPYSAETETEKDQTLSDGTTIRLKGITLRTFRDVDGRTRSEHFPLMLVAHPSQDEQPLLVIISDPGAHTMYQLNPKTHVALLMIPIDLTMPAMKPSPSRQPPKPAPAHAETKTEDLGTQTIEGLLVDGTRTTRTLPVGMEGNDRPLTTVSERWISKELNLLVLSKTTSPAVGEETVRLINISRDDPDPTLFRIPADYTIEPQQ